MHCPEKCRATMLKIKIATRACLHSAPHILIHVLSLASWSFKQTYAPRGWQDRAVVLKIFFLFNHHLTTLEGRGTRMGCYLQRLSSSLKVEFPLEAHHLRLPGQGSGVKGRGPELSSWGPGDAGGGRQGTRGRALPGHSGDSCGTLFWRRHC